VEAGDGGVDPGLQVLVALVLVFASLEKAFEFVGVAGAACFQGLAAEIAIADHSAAGTRLRRRRP
jgi:hypothetical protein